MQLLVSVANPTDAQNAVDGGADLVDAKDPTAGALGAVSLDALRQIHRVVAGRRAVSAALGDAGDEDTIERMAFEYGSAGLEFVKVGFAGITSPTDIDRLIRAAVRGAGAVGQQRCNVVAVAYADTGGTSSIDRTTLVDVAARAGASGVLLDTALKSGRGLRQLVPHRTLESWVDMAHRAGLFAALAGQLTAEDLPCLYEIGADIAGVRGAACAAGRSSPVVRERIRTLRLRLPQLTHS